MASLATASTFFSQIQPCPEACSVVGLSSGNWTAYHSLDRLKRCRQSVLFDYNIFSSLDTPSTILACTVDGDVKSKTSDCAPSTFTSVSLEVASWNKTKSFAHSSSVSQVVGALQSQVDSSLRCGNSEVILFAKYGDVIAGIYVGAGIDASAAVQKIAIQVNGNATLSYVGDALAAQVCDTGYDRTHTIGLMISTTGNHGMVQSAVQSWANATCVKGADSTTASNITVSTVPAINNTRSVNNLQRRVATCSYVLVASGDSCGSLTSKCGITAAELSRYNPSSTLCSTLAVGQPICCSAGSLPDLSPQPSSDGLCYSYTVKSGDYCGLLAQEYHITTDDIEKYNSDTWGWMGCLDLQLGATICLSSGDAPMPAVLSNAECGPQVRGTVRPSNWSHVSSLNPCPLNACCDIWGECGITPEFCTISKSITGAPGTAAKNTNGCISNCGTSIAGGGGAGFETQFMNIGYFEAFGVNRPCLVMDASQLPSSYSHVHFAFGQISDDFDVDLSAVESQFKTFAALRTSFKRILSFGGWSFSTSLDSYPIFREGVTEANRLKFAQSVVSVVNEYNLDGLDFDWEYPGAPDIPGIPPGSPTDGPNYLQFLTTVRKLLPAHKTLSIAAPASYWYLRGFPIANMSEILDYIVYETYDLHGQWDWHNAFSNSGCAHGNCLRSHVNLTETEYALAMITKAGVPANKVVVGLASYGRSFGMEDSRCTGPECLFTGPDSTATPGDCTETAGYISEAELVQIASNSHLAKRSVTSWHDSESDSDMMTYGNNTWVAYMSEDTKASRIKLYSTLGFGGAVEWALDLTAFVDAATSLTKEAVTASDQTCTNPVIVNASINSAIRWNGVGCEMAWTEAIASYQVGNGGGLIFPEAISNYFHGPESMACGVTSDNNGCSSFMECQDTSVPAGYLILNSFVTLNNALLNFYDAISRVQVTVTDEVGALSSTFTAVPPSETAFKILLDIIGLSYALFAAPVWNAVLKGTSYFARNGNTLGTLKDSVNALVSNGITLVKDSQDPSLGEQNTLTENLVAMVTVWYNSVDQLNQELFNGSDSSIATLHSVITNGQLEENAYSPISDPDIQNLMLKAIYATVIPQTWLLSPTRVGPVVLASGAACGTVNPIENFIGVRNGDATWVCYNNEIYYLVGAIGAAQDCIFSGKDGPSCSNNKFTPLPGEQKLNGTAWGGLTIDDLVIGALATYAANGNANGGGLADPSNPQTLSSLYDLNVRAPGVVTIPVCGPQEAWTNWAQYSFGDGMSAHYPCN
ncbi:hypothetical protein V1525DRAFT_391821 [Lipomyces kononenkoae]|uniref:Uncharacterized protein n=1 Tax=Lipomyces kononenkoae TaxID=34357 RepID=A0ACC3SR73_LIPKO